MDVLSSFFDRYFIPLDDLFLGKAKRRGYILLAFLCFEVFHLQCDMEMLVARWIREYAVSAIVYRSIFYGDIAEGFCFLSYFLETSTWRGTRRAERYLFRF